MTDPLEPVYWRIERADEHLSALDRERDAFLDQKDRRIVGHFDRDACEYVFKHTGEPPDGRLGIVVGEFAHNLRAALDNLLWQLVLLRGGTPTSKTQFPIYESRERYESSVWMLRGVSADDRAAIKAIQPYHAGKRAPDSYLALLSWLNNVDKHRFVHVTGAFPRHLDMPVYYMSRESKSAGFFPWHVANVRDIGKRGDVKYVPMIAPEDRTELLRVPIVPSGPNPEMKVDGDPPLEVALSDRQHSLILPDLRGIHGFVKSVVDGLRPRFDV